MDNAVKKRGKKLIIISTCFALISGGILTYCTMGSGTEETRKDLQWEQYAPSHAPFTAQFPAEPRETKEPMRVAGNQIIYYQVTADKDGASYTVSYLKFPKVWKWIGTNKLLKKTFAMMVENDKNIEQVLSSELANHNGHSALNYQMIQEGKRMNGKLIVSGNTLYRITVESPLDKVDLEKVETFINSVSVQ